MFFTQITASVRGNVIANLEIKGRTYPGLSFGVVDSLCTDVIQGQAFMKRHNEVCWALKAQKMPFADSTEHSQWEVVAASVFAIPQLQSNDPQYLQHSIYW